LASGFGQVRSNPDARWPQPFSVTVVFGWRRAVEPVTYRPVMALRLVVAVDRFRPEDSVTDVRLPRC
jgi:hypothetical protein